MRQEWDGQLLLGELEPVERLEPPVVLDVVRSILEAAIALRDISDEEMLDDALGIPIISRYRSKLSGLNNQILAAKAIFDGDCDLFIPADKIVTYLSKSRGNLILPFKIFW